MLRPVLAAVAVAAAAVLAVPASTALASTAPAPAAHVAVMNGHGHTAAQRAEHNRQVWLANWRDRVARDRLARASNAYFAARNRHLAGARWVAIQREYVAAQNQCNGTQRQIVLLRNWH